MEFTKNELEIAERCLSKREKQVAQWPRKRWIMLAVCLVVMLIGFRSVMDAERSIQDDRGTDLDVSRAIGDPPPAGLEQRWVVGTMLKISKVLELRHQIVTTALIEFAIGFMQLASGATVVCLVILRWNTGERDALICKLLRAKLQELEQNAASRRGPLSQPPPLLETQTSDSRRTTSPASGA